MADEGGDQRAHPAFIVAVQIGELSKGLGRPLPDHSVAILTTRNSVAVSITATLQNVRMVIARVAEFGDFQSEYELTKGISRKREDAVLYVRHRASVLALCVPKTSSECDAAMESPKLAG
jgi:hypothetical protein